MALLAAKSLHLAHGQALHADTRQCFLNLIEFEGFDDRLDFFHVLSSPSAKGLAPRDSFRARGDLTQAPAQSQVLVGGRFLARAESMLLADEQAADILMMTKDRERGDDECGDHIVVGRR